MSNKKTKAKVIKQNVGADMSKDEFKVVFYRLDQTGRKYIKGSRTFKNTLAGFMAFVEWIEKHRIKELEVRITLEATGIYHENLVHFLDDNDYYVSVVLANQAKAYAKSLNQKSKTDQEDARMLGQMGIERDLPKWHRASANLRILKQLTRDRVNLLNEKVALKNKIHALDHSFEPHKKVLKRMNQRLKLIEKQIKQVEKEIKQTVQEDPVLKVRIGKVCKVKGLALATVATVVAETDGFALFNSRGQLVSYAGYDIVEGTVIFDELCTSQLSRWSNMNPNSNNYLIESWIAPV